MAVGGRRVAAGAQVIHHGAPWDNTASRAWPGFVTSRAIRAANPSARAGDWCYADRSSPRNAAPLISGQMFTRDWVLAP